MILRRLTEHVRTQNWFAVGLDFLIVVIGVFIGIEVSNWNETRSTRALESDYLQRLHDEAVTGLEGLLRTTELGYTNTRKHGNAAVEVILGVDAEDALNTDVSLTQQQCNALIGLHGIIAFPFQFPSLEEMIASGQFEAIEDQRIRFALTQYTLMQKNSQAVVDYFTADHVVLPVAFPDYFTPQRPDLDAEGWVELRYACAPRLMAADPAFRNRLAESAARFNRYYQIVLRREIDTVRQIHDLLDDALGVSHPERER